MYLLLIHVLTLLHLVAGQSQKTFTLSGHILLPENGQDYSYMPAESCIHLTLQEDIYCGEWGECNPEKSGEHFVRDMQIVDNKVEYKFEAKKLESGMYNLGAILNIGHCSNAGEFKVGDYLNVYSNTFRLSPEVNSIKRDIEVMNPNEEDDYFLNNKYTTTVPPETTTPKSTLESTTPTTTTTPSTTTTTTKASTPAPTTTIKSTTSTIAPDTEPAPTTQSRTTTPLATQSTEEDKDLGNFNVYGRIELPSINHDYTNMPSSSCIHIHIYEDVYCHDSDSNCNPKVSGHHIVKDLKVIDNKIGYSFDAKKLKSGLYNIGAIMNIKECTKGEGHYNKGDYLNMMSYTFEMKPEEESLLQDIKISCPEEETDYFLKKPDPRPIYEKHVVKGFMMLPKDGDYSSLTNEGCMQLHLYPEDFVCNVGHCPKHILLSLFMPLRDVNEYKLEYKMDIFKLPKGKYMIRAVIHVGWCEKELSSENWIHEADYYTKEIQHIDLNEADENNVLYKDLKLAPHKKYHCGKEKCCMDERCVVDEGLHRNHCVKDSRGRYGKGGRRHPHHHHSHHKVNGEELENIAIAVVAIVALFIIILAVFFCCKKKAKSKKSSFWYSKFQNSFKSSSLKFPVPAEKDTPDNFYVSEPVICTGAKVEREITKNPVYLEKNDYVEFNENKQDNVEQA